LISDIEMPVMDGYTLTAEIKQDDRMKNMPVILHTSLSGVFNNAMVEKVGAEDFIPKFHPDELATAVKKWLKHDEIS
jgi:two-component system chemotaxis response regulator CheV